MSTKIINPIKDALVALLTSKQADLGIKTVAKDISLDNLTDDIDKLITAFPATIVVYYGRSPVRKGTVLELTLTYAVIVATRSVQAPNASDPIAADLLDPIMELIQGRNLDKTVQRDGFTLTSETLQHKDKTMTIYQQLYETIAAVNFRDALAL